jgi:hypothetical protein
MTLNAGKCMMHEEPTMVTGANRAPLRMRLHQFLASSRSIAPLRGLFHATVIVGLIAGCATTSEPGARPAAKERAQASPLLQVGAASGEINPAAGVMLAGYGYNRRCTGVHDPLYAKAVVFDDGVTPVALVVIDSFGLQYPTIQEIRTAAAAKVTAIELPAERILVQSTHTHCAPDTVGLWGATPNVSGVNPEYLAKVVATASEQVARAVAARVPAYIVHSSGETRGWVANRSQPEKLDTSVTVLQCVDEDGDTIASLTHFACAPSVLDSKTTLVSADFVGAFYRSMNQTLDGEHLFLQGAIGGWVQPVAELRTFPKAREYGVELARTVVRALGDPKVLTDGTIRFNHKTLTIPVTNTHFQEMTEAGVMLRPYAETVETEVAWFAVGDAQFATHPGASTPALGWATKDLMNSGPRFVLGLGLDALGFILTHDFFQEKDIPHAEYLVSMSVGPDAAPAVMDALRAIIP